MRILLVGEYSRLHNSLKEGLTILGHDVVIIGNGDGFKNYPVDIKIDHSFHNPFLKKFKVAFYKLTSINIAAYEIYIKTLLVSKKLKGFDVVQLINESSIKSSPELEIRFLNRILKNNKRLYYLSCGIDYQCMTYMMEGKFKYSIMSPYLADKTLYDTYKFQLQYLNKEHKKLHDFIYEHSTGVIASDMDYHIPLLGHNAYLGMIPNAINVDKIAYIPYKIEDKIKIFHGVNSKVMAKKGNAYFVEALKIIESRYGDKVEVITTYSIPYAQYIKLYDDCHILLDQVYGYDQGYNALEAMAKGKVVFTGAEDEWLDYYQLEPDTVAINALPDVNYLVEKLSWLIENPDKIIEISKNARAFIEREHHYLKIAQTYITTWETHSH